MNRDQLAFHMDLSSPFEARSIRLARKAINLIALEWGYTEQACREMELGFGEAIQNALDHGCNGKETIHISCFVYSKQIKIIIEDPGVGNGNLKTLKDAFERDDQVVPCCDNERGRGVFLIRNLMDEANLECLKGGGVRITLIKNKPDD